MGWVGSPGLGTGVMVASFHSCGISPVWNDRLKRDENDGASSLAASLSKRFGIESNPGLLLVSTPRRSFSTSAWEVEIS